MVCRDELTVSRSFKRAVYQLPRPVVPEGVRANVIRALDQEETLSADYATHLTSTLSAVRDLDYAAAISQLSQQLFGLEAAQRAFARTEDLSLFRYL